MFESFIIMVREGVEAALVIGILLVALRQSGRRYLERPVYIGVAMAVFASVAAAIALQFLPLSDELYEGTLYWVSAVFVISMMFWMHRTGKSLGASIKRRVAEAPAHGRWEAWGLGAFAFLMVFREGAEAVMFLSAVTLTTDAMLSFIGSVAGLIVAVVFAVMFVRGSVRVDLRRFFRITEWVLGIFVAQLVINGYHEFSEAGLLPATQRTMALIGPIVRNNSLFILAIVAIPLFIWITGAKKVTPTTDGMTDADRRLTLATTRRERSQTVGAIVTTLIVLGAVGALYAHEVRPRTRPAPEMVMADVGTVEVPLTTLADGTLHRYGFVSDGRTVRFLALKTSDGKIRTAFDACEICGAFGYIQEGDNLICLNCSAEINPRTLGATGGCNPIPLASEVTPTAVRVRVGDLQKEATRFAANGQTAKTEIDPVCGMQVRIANAAASETINGKTTYFCSEQCRSTFDKELTKK